MYKLFVFVKVEMEILWEGNILSFINNVFELHAKFKTVISNNVFLSFQNNLRNLCMLQIDLII